MRYLLLIYDDESKMPPPEQMTPEMMQPWMEYTADLQKSGAMLAGEALLPTATGTTVRLTGSKEITTDGPFAETKEQLGGFYMVTAKDLDAALAMARRMPNLPHGGSVEVRPIAEFGDAG